MYTDLDLGPTAQNRALMDFESQGTEGLLAYTEATVASLPDHARAVGCPESFIRRLVWAIDHRASVTP